MVPAKNAPSSMDGKDDESEDFGVSWSEKNVDEGGKDASALISWRFIKKDCLEKLLLLGRIEGRRGRGRPRIKYLTSLNEDIPRDMQFVDLV